MYKIPSVPVQIETVLLRGGMDMHSAPSEAKPGTVRSGVNYCCAETGGYRRIGAYERFDGRQSPTQASPLILGYTSFQTLSVGNVITGGTSGATGTLAYVGEYLAVVKVTGTFQVGESILVSAVAKGAISSLSPSVSSRLLYKAMKLAAENIYRADILKPTGSGPTRGGFRFGPDMYVWRDNAGATACNLWRSSNSGWVQVVFKYELAFTAGSGTPPAIASTITKGAVTAVVRKIVLTSGTWAGGTAAGRFVIDTIAGGPFTAGAFTAGVTATASGAEQAQTWSAGGRFEHVINDFATGEKVYGCNGLNYAFEFDGTTISTIRTGMADDTPEHIQAHTNRLWLTFGPSLQHSGIGDPAAWTALLGAAEIRVGSNITCLSVLPGGANAAMLITTERSTHVLYGNSDADFKLNEFPNTSGAAARSTQIVGLQLMFGAAGLVSFTQAQEFGNFSAVSLTAQIRDFIQERGVTITDSVVNHRRSQYRAFFADGYGIYATIVQNQLIGVMPVKFPNPVIWAWNSGAATGDERTYFGDDTGMVYQLDIGTSFDGTPIDASLSTVFNSSKGDAVRKTYRSARIEVQGSSYAVISMRYELDYGRADVDQSESFDLELPIFSGRWGEGHWGDSDPDFGGRNLAPIETPLRGVGSNLSMTFSQSSALFDEYTLNSVTTLYSTRRVQPLRI